jgi:hypothetical protein
VSLRHIASIGAEPRRFQSVMLSVLMTFQKGGSLPLWQHRYDAMTL